MNGFNPNCSKYAELLKLRGHRKENVRGIANENHGGTCTKTLLSEMLWVHSDAQDAFALFLQFRRDKMDDHIEEGSVEEEEDEGSNSSFFVRGGDFLWLGALKNHSRTLT